MNLSPRERNIALVVGVLVALWALNFFLIDPLLASRTETLDAIDAARLNLQTGKDLKNARPRLERQLSDNVQRGLTRDQSSAESQLLNNLRQWANESDLALPSLKPSGAAQPVVKPGGKSGEKLKAFNKVSVRATGTGNLLQIARFLYRIQTASTPVRITDFSITSKKDGIDDLEVNLNMSTIFLTADAGQIIPGIAPTTVSASRPTSQPRGRS